MCTFCLKHLETTNDLFLDCKIVEKVWKAFKYWISTILRVNIVSSYVNKLLGFQENSIGFRFLNSLLLFAWFLVYRCKYSNSRPKMLHYLYFLHISKLFNMIYQKKNCKVDNIFENDILLVLTFNMYNSWNFLGITSVCFCV